MSQTVIRVGGKYLQSCVNDTTEINIKIHMCSFMLQFTRKTKRNRAEMRSNNGWRIRKQVL